MVYIGTKTRKEMYDELGIFSNKKPYITKDEAERLILEIEIKTGVDEATAREALIKFVRAGRLSIVDKKEADAIYKAKMEKEADDLLNAKVE